MAKSLAVWIGNVDNVNLTKGKLDIATDAYNTPEQPMPESKAEAELELHFNYWSFGKKGKNHRVNYLDVGVFYQSPDSDINLFFPFNLTKDDIDCSLGRVVCHDIEILSAIFNSSVLNLSYPDTNPYAEVKTKNSKGEEDYFKFYFNFDIGELANNVKLRNFGDGCIITFPNSVFGSAEGRCYLRFRIYLNEISKRAISQSYISKDRFLLTKSEEIEIIDFRVNELRNMPSGISPLLSHNSPLKTVHFFVIREANVESRMSDSTFQRCRLLEEQPWGKYLALESTSKSKKLFDKEPPPQMLIYHWKSESKKDDKSQDKCGLKSKQLLNFAALAKFSHVKTSWPQIGMYALIIIGLGVISSLAASWLFGYLTSGSMPSSNSDIYFNCLVAEHEKSRSEFKELKELTSIDKSFTPKDIYHIITPRNTCSVFKP